MSKETNTKNTLVFLTILFLVLVGIKGYSIFREFFPNNVDAPIVESSEVENTFNPTVYADTCIKIVKEVFDVELEYNEDSIMKLDSIIDEGWPTYPADVEETTILSFGAFLGEAIIASLGAEWVETEDGWGVEVQNMAAENIILLPYALVEKRFEEGRLGSISLAYKIFKLKTEENTSTE